MKPGKHAGGRTREYTVNHHLTVPMLTAYMIC